MHAQKLNIHDNQKILIVEGNIGAGKSTFLKKLNDHLNAQVVYEPIHMWQNVAGDNLLEKFYKDTNRWAYTFQTYAFVSRILEQNKYLSQTNGRVQVLERSVFSDRYCFGKNCYEMGLMSSLEWNLYKEWFEWLVFNYLPKPTGFIYLKTSPEVCYKRLQKRARSEENIVEFDYILKLHQKHESWLIEKQGIADYLKDIPVLVIDCDEDFEFDIELQKSHINKIIEFFKLDNIFLDNAHINQISL